MSSGTRAATLPPRESAQAADTNSERLSPILTGLPTFGAAGEGKIRVLLFGRAVKNPGYYYLPRGSNIHDAIGAAHVTLTEVSWHPPYSCLRRPKPDGSIEMISFTRAMREQQEQIVLQEGDRILLSHEVY